MREGEEPPLLALAVEEVWMPTHLNSVAKGDLFQPLLLKCCWWKQGIPVITSGNIHPAASGTAAHTGRLMPTEVFTASQPRQDSSQYTHKPSRGGVVNSQHLSV